MNWVHTTGHVVEAWAPRFLADSELFPQRVLLAEDDAATRALVSEDLRAAGYSVVGCADGAALLGHLGAGAVLDKPFDIKSLRRLVAEAVDPGCACPPERMHWSPVLAVAVGPGAEPTRFSNRDCR